LQGVLQTPQLSPKKPRTTIHHTENFNIDVTLKDVKGDVFVATKDITLFVHGKYAEGMRQFHVEHNTPLCE
jgi:hypothetical protein